MSDKLVELYRAKIRAKTKYESYVKEIAGKWGCLKTSIKTNIDYRLNDYERWKEMDFVIGIEIKRSRNYKPCDLCDAMCGRYPKDFIFIGWHPDCICYAVPVLMEDGDFAQMQLISGSRKYREKLEAKGINPIDILTKIKENDIEDIPNTVIPFIQQNIKQSKDPYFLDLNNMFYLYVMMKEAENEYILEKNH